jgi:hypothetical protein
MADFTAEELLGRQIRIEGPVPKKGNDPTGHTIRIIADDDLVDNAYKAVLILEAGEITQAKIMLYRHDKENAPTEEVTLRDNLEVSFSAIVSEVD